MGISSNTLKFCISDIFPKNNPIPEMGKIHFFCAYCFGILSSELQGGTLSTFLRSSQKWSRTAHFFGGTGYAIAEFVVAEVDEKLPGCRPRRTTFFGGTGYAIVEFLVPKVRERIADRIPTRTIFFGGTGYATVEFLQEKKTKKKADCIPSTTEFQKTRKTWLIQEPVPPNQIPDLENK